MSTMEYIKIADLEPVPYNPRSISQESLELLKQSLVDDPKFFEKRPCLVNRREGKLFVYAGAQRLKAAQELGWESVPCDIEDNVDPKLEKMRNLKDNRTFGDWLWENLKEHYTTEELLAAGFKDEELGLSPEVEKELEKDTNPLDGTMENYLNSNIRQIVLYFDAPQYEDVIKRLMKIMADTGKESNTEVFMILLEGFESKP